MNDAAPEKPYDQGLISISDLTDVSDPLLSGKGDARPDGAKHIIFALGTSHFAVPAGRVAEVVRPLPCTELPNLPGWLAGIANLRGDILTVIDLQAFWSADPPADSPRTKLIVLRPADPETRVAFRVDKLREITTLPEGSVEPAGENDPPFISGRFSHRSEPVRLLDVEKVLASLEL